MQVASTSMPGFVNMRKGSTTITGYLGTQTSVLEKRIASYEQQLKSAVSQSNIERLQNDIARAKSMLAATNKTSRGLVHKNILTN